MVLFFIYSPIMLRKNTDNCRKLINRTTYRFIFPVIDKDNTSSINMINDRIKCLIFHYSFFSHILQYLFEVADESLVLNAIHTMSMILISMIA